MMTVQNNNSMAGHAAKNARCPRCGYDLRGIMEIWDNSCDLNGTCSECGLEFEWGDLLSPKRNVPKWCVESVATRRDGGRMTFSIATLKTLLMIFRPWRFWLDLKMSHVPRWRAIVNLHLCLLLGSYLAFLFALGLSVASEWKTNAGTYAAMDLSRFEAISITVIMPLSEQSLGSGAAQMGMIYPSPYAYTQELLNYWWYSIAMSIVVLALYYLLCPICFLALPQSRRQAKVRWGHIIRICTYSYVLVWGFFYCTLVLASLIWNSSSPTKIFDDILVGLFMSLFLYGFIWWSLATSRYLKMRHPWGVGLAVSVMSILGVMAIGLILNSFL